MSVWPLARLGDFIHVKHGYAFKGENFSSDGDAIILTPGNFKTGGGLQFRPGKEKYYTGEYPPEFRLVCGQLLVVMTDLKQDAPILGSAARVPPTPPTLHNQRLGLVSVTNPDQLDERFLFHLLNDESSRRQLRATATGTTVRHTAPKRIYEVKFALPTIDEQRDIASILDSIDDLIDNNRRRIELLEEIARATYREWFVHFRFTGRADAALVESRLGPIPEGWEVATLGSIARFEKGLSYKGSFLTEDGVPMANLKCVRAEGGFRRDGTKPYSGTSKAKHQIFPGDIIMANTDLTQAGGVIGAAALVPKAGFIDGGIISHHLFAVRPADRRYRHWLLRHFNDLGFRDFARGVASGTTVLGLRAHDVEEREIVLPDLEVVAEFERTSNELAQLVEALHETSDLLASVRNLLLPKLISGEISLSDLGVDALLEAPS